MTEQHKDPVAGHTPGPWGISTDGCAPFTIDSADANICELMSGTTADMPTIEADARLIAAAPDLLEALDKALSALQRLHTDVEALIADSEGVYGLHHNGDPSPWDELQQGGQHEDWLGVPLWAARNAWHDGQAVLSQATGEQS